MQEYLIDTSGFGLRALTEKDFDYIYRLATSGDTLYLTGTKWETAAQTDYFDFEFVYSPRDVKILVNDVWGTTKSCQRYALVNKASGELIGLCAVGEKKDSPDQRHVEFAGLTNEASSLDPDYSLALAELTLHLSHS